ncbi:CoA transferase [Bradyrhizobium sp. 38]|uniref:CoA transferase n=1 Tax=unclassified Bradyrhizobium TaxID=2631580 RepID=UPI001FF756BC|nr:MULTISPECIES: CoA transferase [unclassified Bradyrhizobium]MCK1341129.1 CoA transferase [Bradyrhizobium sp. 38]MCK1780992.1 CoA transferase [Bradyrhizobium sp. 132]
MSPIALALDRLSTEIATLSGRLGRRVAIPELGVTDRARLPRLKEPGLVSPNGACRLVRVTDGWIAVNLAREEDRELVPAWLGCDFDVDPWAAIDIHAPGKAWRALIADAETLGLPAAGLGEVVHNILEAPSPRMSAGRAFPDRQLRVVDLSALWAGPLCGAVLAAAGCAVIKVESTRRLDPTRASTPELFRRLNAAKSEMPLDLATNDGRARLKDAILGADAVITSARPRGLASLGLSCDEVFAARPGLVWVAISGYGWTGVQANRVAFGDDAAAAGGLVRWTASGAPRFLGDALADPVTGLAAAAGALKAIMDGGGVLVDAALADSAAGAAVVCGFRSAA